MSRLAQRIRLRLADLATGLLTETAYTRLRRLGFRPNGIVDAGAYQGEWSRLIAGVFPRTPIVMIDAQEDMSSTLQLVQQTLAETGYKICLLGASEGTEVPFNLMGRGSGIYRERSNVPRSMVYLTTQTLDNVMTEFDKLRDPLLVKLDVQGAELDVLQGATNTLEKTEIIQLEVSLMRYHDDAPTIYDVFEFMKERGFVPFDVCGFVRAPPKYLALMQADILFAREYSILRSNYFMF
jgi:FkbM family methyltransferase